GGPEISVIGFGAWEAGGQAWGPNPPDDQTIAAVHAGIDAGMSWVDTAEIYGGGRSEELVGRALSGRDDVMVFTKLAPTGPGSGFARDQVRTGAERSLNRLGRDVIDLYQLHWPDNRVPLEETWEAMAALVDEGLVKWIGLSNFERDALEKCEKIRHVDSLQPHFSMLHQKGRRDLFPFCGNNGTGIICYGPLAFGLLTGAFTKDTKFGDDDWRGGKTPMGYYADFYAPGKFEQNLGKVDSLRPVAERLGASLAQLALAWVTHQDGVSGAIAGSRSPKHVAENAGGGDLVLEDKDLEEIDSLLG
ncbi:MAG: aldo/keto reductase, partial [Actinomycetota bacterium]|nr:aldo/keto reductase [Actinomycetota bacterium]